MRLNRWMYAAGSIAMVGSGALAEQACSSSNYCSTTGTDTTCYIYTPQTGAGSGASTTTDGGSGVKPGDAGNKDAADAADPVPPFGPGDGTPCKGPVGGFPDPACDPSDELAQACSTPFDAGCTFDKRCGDLHTCEPFTKNPLPGKGVENFRMRLINITAPPSLANPTVQGSVVSTAVDLPAATDAGGAPCGENGTGYFNWLLSVDKANGKVTTGGAPPSTDPFSLGYCYLNGTVEGTKVAPVSVNATFTGNSFTTDTLTTTLNIPIFLVGTPPGAVILPIRGVSMHDVTISTDGNCIGAVNNLASIPPSPGAACSDPVPAGTDSCSRWHSAGAFGGYITLSDADGVLVQALNESLCVLLLGAGESDGQSPAHCKSGYGSMGNYDSKTNQPATAGDSFWLSAQFAASAVNIAPKTSNSLCNGGTFGSGGTGSGS